jgi:hypothetical protein
MKYRTFLKTNLEPEVFEKNGRQAKVMYVKDNGYELHKTDPRDADNTRVSQYSTKERAINAAKAFINHNSLRTKGCLSLIRI